MFKFSGNPYNSGVGTNGNESTVTGTRTPPPAIAGDVDVDIIDDISSSSLFVVIVNLFKVD
jgi:hypothetical protein